MNMFYLLVNVESTEYILVPKSNWITTLSTALKLGWKPRGTKKIQQSNLYFTAENGILIKGHLQSTEGNSHHWNGSYTLQENQIVKENDASEIASLLESAEQINDLIQFFKKGSFWIGEAGLIKSLKAKKGQLIQLKRAQLDTSETSAVQHGKRA